ncbi:hypothetical protein [Lignipirellula cremea]|uniref:Leucine Rich repeats (2 copies) n=1 Tax=Lignipirellula cremea TaxID=2528010 RepID=A0A518DVA9_9BACT|nr:hypothetical protein [Lignipirellula cremea]QDU95772.1 hypothetical protein Pla8534_35890 [Lignipirellula cremea]
MNRSILRYLPLLAAVLLLAGAARAEEPVSTDPFFVQKQPDGSIKVLIQNLRTPLPAAAHARLLAETTWTDVQVDVLDLPLARVLARCRHLQKLWVSFESKPGALEALSGSQSLRELQSYSLAPDREEMRWIARLPSLESLRLKRLSAEAAAGLADFRSLRTLELGIGRQDSSPDILKAVSQIAGLEELILGFSSRAVPPAASKSLANLTNLNKLEVAWSRHDFGPYDEAIWQHPETTYLDAVLLPLLAGGKLESLRLQNINVSQDLAEAIVRQTHLRELVVHGGFSWAECESTLLQCAELEVLELAIENHRTRKGPYTRDERAEQERDAIALQRMKRLRKLVLNRPPRRILEALAQVEQLQEFTLIWAGSGRSSFGIRDERDLYCFPVEFNRNLSRAVLKPLADAQSLRKLTLQTEGVQRGALAALNALPHLRELTVRCDFARTNLAAECPQLLPQLERLDLRGMALGSLQKADLHLPRLQKLVLTGATPTSLQPSPLEKAMANWEWDPEAPEEPHQPLPEWWETDRRDLRASLLEIVERAKNVSLLRLEETQISANGLIALGTLPNLKDVSLLNVELEGDLPELPGFARLQIFEAEGILEKSGQLKRALDQRQERRPKFLTVYTPASSSFEESELYSDLVSRIIRRRLTYNYDDD